MSNTEKSRLVQGNHTYNIAVRTFIPPQFEAPGRRGRKIPGRIQFVIDGIGFDIDGIGYEIFHENERFRFEAVGTMPDFKASSSIVVGAVY